MTVKPQQWPNIQYLLCWLALQPGDDLPWNFEHACNDISAESSGKLLLIIDNVDETSRYAKLHMEIGKILRNTFADKLSTLV